MSNQTDFLDYDQFLLIFAKVILLEVIVHEIIDQIANGSNSLLIKLL